MSSNGTYLNNEKIGKGNQRELKTGDSIHLLHFYKVKKKNVLGFIFS